MSMLQALKARLLAIKLKRQILEVEVSWEWAANQALSGAISGGTGWAVGFALNEIFGPSQPSIGALLQQFAEQFAGMLREQGIRARVTDVNVEVTTLIRNLSSTSGGLSSTQLLREADRASGILSRTSVDDEIRLRVMPSFAIVLPIYVGTLFELARKGPPDNMVTAVAFANDQIGFIRSMLRNVESIYPDWTEDLIQPAHDRVSAEVNGFPMVHLDGIRVESSLLGPGGNWINAGGGLMYVYESVRHAEAAADFLRREVVHPGMSVSVLAPIKHIVRVLSRATDRFVLRRFINSVIRWR